MGAFTAGKAAKDLLWVSGAEYKERTGTGPDNLLPYPQLCISVRNHTSYLNREHLM